MIVVDTSSLIAIAGAEAGWQALADRLLGDEAVLSSGTLAEAKVVSGQRGLTNELLALIRSARIRVVPVSAEQALSVGPAYRQWGRGNHPAALNFGDCFAYALAGELDCPLLFVGNDFSRTDITSAI